MSIQVPLFDQRGSTLPRAGAAQATVGGFNVTRFVETFGVLAEAPKSISVLRQLVLDLAVRGLVAPQDPRDMPATLGGEAGDADQTEGLRPFEIPSTWAWTTVDRLCSDSFYGPRFGKGEYVTEGGIPTIRTTDMSDSGQIVLRDAPLVRVPPEKLKLYQVEQDDLLITRTGSIGIMAVFEGDYVAIPSAYLIRFRFRRETVTARFIYTFLKSSFGQDHLGLGTTTTAQPNVNATTIRAIPIPLPPLAEQKRIVAKVDQLMALCDDFEAKQTKKRETSTRLTKSALEALTTAEGPEEFDAAWKRVVENFDVLIDRAEKVGDLRSLVLELAFRGSLIRPVSGDSSSSALRKQVEAGWTGRKRKEALSEVEHQERPMSPARWDWVRLGNLAEVVGGVTKGRNLKDRHVRSYPYLRVANVQRGYLDLGLMKEIEIPVEELDKYRLASGDILFTEGGDWDKLGRSAIWRGEIEPCIHQNHVFRARMVHPTLDPSWFSMFANSPIGRRYFENAAKQTTNLASINMTQLRNCPMPLPPLAEQKRIVAKVEQLMRVCDDLEAKLRRAEDRASKLVEAVVQELVA